VRVGKERRRKVGLIIPRQSYTLILSTLFQADETKYLVEMVHSRILQNGLVWYALLRSSVSGQYLAGSAKNNDRRRTQEITIGYADEECVGEELHKGTTLEPKQYICLDGPDGQTDVKNAFKFGLNGEGRLGLFQGHTTKWEEQYDGKGAFLTMDEDGVLVVSDKDGKPLYKGGVGCEASGSKLAIKEDGVYIVNQRGYSEWEVDMYGNRKDCLTGRVNRLCEASSVLGKTCRMRIVDHNKGEYLIYEVNDATRSTFEVSDINTLNHCSARRLNSEKVGFDGENMFLTNGASPNQEEKLECEDFLEKYRRSSVNDPERDFKRDSEYPCTKFGRSMIYYAIAQYYGEDV
jgi:hypothetical protein